MHDLVAALLQFGEDRRQRGRGRSLDVVEQDDAAVLALDLIDGAGGEPRRAADVAVVGDDVDGEGGDAALLQMREQRAGIAEARKAEERRDRLAGGERHGGKAALDLVGGAFQRLSERRFSGCDQVCVPMVWPRPITSLTMSG